MPIMFKAIIEDLEEFRGMQTHKNLNLSPLRIKSKSSEKTKLALTSMMSLELSKLAYLYYKNSWEIKKKLIKIVKHALYK